jgi:hypothetical protein
MITRPVGENSKTVGINLQQEIADTLERQASSLRLSSEDYINTILKNWFNSVENADCRRCRPDMYRICELESHLRVELKDDFCFGTIRTIIHNVTSLPLYTSMDDIWLIGKHHALISMGDIEELVADFRCVCSRSATRKKTAVVVDEGRATESIVQLWVEGVDKQLPFECSMFHTLAEAESWLGVAESNVA